MISILGYAPANERGYVTVDVMFDDDYRGHIGKRCVQCSIKQETWNFIIDGIKKEDLPKSLPIDVTGKYDVRCNVREGKRLNYFFVQPRV